ncbi:hypothetical protein [Telluribacter sp. SYSU D00476]|uniref:hypothetical protein n=1 Tax=Telluribacter sp. SYSU D00476 TaxID=2811430 RepID=UPI001FF4E596|nr:hypothetical protein [Telluribacter sp. SYSU D00476]
MTEVSTDHPSGLPYIELTEQGRKISFRKECLGDVKIFRKVNDGEEELLVQGIRTPYTDADSFPEGSKLTYTIELDQDRQKHQYHLEARL